MCSEVRNLTYVNSEVERVKLSETRDRINVVLALKGEGQGDAP